MNELLICNNINDFRKLAKSKLPFPIFHYIDGGADDEVTLKRNTESFNNCDLVPNVLRGVGDIDLSIKLFGKTIDLPFFLSPTALQRLFHYKGEMAVGEAYYGKDISENECYNLAKMEAEKKIMSNAGLEYVRFFNKDICSETNEGSQCKLFQDSMVYYDGAL